MTDDASTREVNQLLALLGNETRMNVIRTLWEGFDFQAYVTESRQGTPHSTLFEESDASDKGNFNYHLRRLVGALIEEHGDGYVLSPLGFNLIRSIDRYEDFDYYTLDERTVETPCPFCGGSLLAEYRREILSIECADCDGLASGGNFTFVEVPAAERNRTDVGHLLDAATLSMSEKIRASAHGICWKCSGPMDRTLDVCGDHERRPSGTCSACEERYRAKIDNVCPDCGTIGRGPLLEYAILSPTVVSFLSKDDRDRAMRGPWEYRLEGFSAATEVSVTDDSATFLFERERDGLRVTVESRADGVHAVPEDNG